MKKTTAFVLACLMTLGMLSGCERKDDTLAVAQPKSGMNAFKLDTAKSDQVDLFVANFNNAINKCNLTGINSFISAKSEDQKSMLSYVDSRELKDLFEFYMSRVKLTNGGVYVANDKEYLVLQTEYYDNFYNDFKTPVILTGVDTRAEFYELVESKIADATTLQDSGLKVEGSPQKKKEKTATDEESERVFDFENQDAGIPKGMSHKGQDYTSEKSVKSWIDQLTAEEKENKLEKFKSTIIVKLNQSTETTKIEINSSDLIKLLGSLPVFYGLDYNYNITDYDIFRNYLNYIEDLDDFELQLFDEWHALDLMSDAEIQDLALENVSDGKVFGMFDIHKDIEKIRRCIKPKSMEALSRMYYNEGIVDQYTVMFEIPELYSLISAFRDYSEIELIKQIGKEYYIRISSPDVNAIYTEGKCWSMTSEEAITFVVEKIMSMKFPRQNMYTSVMLQKEPSSKYGFVIVTDFMNKLISDGISPQIAEHFNLDLFLKGKVVAGEITLNGKPVATNRFVKNGELSEKVEGASN